MISALLLSTAALAAVDDPNVVLVLLDDVGVDRVVSYGEHPRAGLTPTLDTLAKRGVLFRNAWANPLCRPTRESLMTGLLPSKTESSGEELIGEDDFTVAEMLQGEGYSTWCVGKWHLSMSLDGVRTEGGFDHYMGVRDNATDYWAYWKIVDGVEEWIPEGEYLTTDEVNDALGFVTRASAPWFLYLPFHAAHAPWHVPPPGLSTIPIGVPPLDDIPLCHRAMVQAMDTELGRFLAKIPEDAWLIVMGDNGTPDVATDAPFDSEHAKGTLYEGGINVPLIVCGPGVVPRESNALVQVTDVWATLADVAGYDGPLPEDSISFLGELVPGVKTPRRQYVVAERLIASRDLSAARNRRYKLIRTVHYGGAVEEEFYDLQGDPWERVNLLAEDLSPVEQINCDYLAAVLDSP